MTYLLMVLLFSTALFLILLILVQRGKGGGLAGAFGGLGGQSAFGTKAGDTFTRITMVVAAIWILLCIFSVLLLGITAGGRLQVAPPPGASSTEGGTSSSSTDAPLDSPQESGS